MDNYGHENESYRIALEKALMKAKIPLPSIWQSFSAEQKLNHALEVDIYRDKIGLKS